jgi:hypothetical protein
MLFFKTKSLAAKKRETPHQPRLFLKPCAPSYSWQNFFSPRFFERMLLGIFFLAFPLYFSLSLERNATPPPLIISTPENGTISEKATVTVEGVSDPFASVFINGGKIILEKDGRFKEALILHKGVNTIHILAERLGASSSLERTIIFNKE